MLAFELIKLIGVPLVVTVILTLALSPILVFTYRRRVTSWMGKSADSTKELPESIENDVSRQSLPDSTVTHVKWHEVSLTDGAAKSGSENALVHSAGRKMRSMRGAYLRAGIVYAVIMTLLWSMNYRWGLLLSVYVFIVFMLPSLAIWIWLGTRSGIRKIAQFCTVVLALFFLSGLEPLLWTLIKYYIVVPLIVFLILNLRFWRGVAPFIAVISLCGSLFAIIAVDLAEPVIGVTPLLWVPRTVGFGLGVWIGLRMLRRIGARHQANQTNNLDLFVNVWLLLYTFWLAITLANQSFQEGNFGASIGFVLAAFAAYLVYMIVKRYQLQRLTIPADGHRPLHLLHLRVFRDDTKSERLFDRLSLQWRWLGPIELIAGWDLALRSIEPLDFVDFLTGNLRRRFVRDSQDLARRIAELDPAPGLGGLYAVHDLLCFADSWENAMQALVQRADAVLMDLRGFSEEREGCRTELQYLARNAVQKPVILLVDDSTELAVVQQIVGAEVATDAAADPAWIVAKIDGRKQSSERDLFAVMTQQLSTEGV